MHNYRIKTPVAFIIFNRPQTTEKVFEAIRKVKPPKLFVIADGPRADRSGEAEKSAASRAIIDRVDWDCEVLKNYSEQNLGSGERVSSGLDWVFDNVEEAIILEDDCLPHPTFFPFCEDLLNYYRNDERIMLISGNNFQFGRKRTEYSYYFSRYPHTWGWASWRRAWQHYDFEMKFWPKIRDDEWLKFILGEPKILKFWVREFQKVYQENLNIWDYKWILSCWINNGLSVSPNVNLITNIGFGSEATNTKDSTSPLSNIPTQEMCFPLQHPPFVIRHAQADYFTQKNQYQYQPNILLRAINKSKKIINNMN